MPGHDHHHVPANHKPSTAALKREYYEYLLEYIGETPLQRELRASGESMAHATMMASPDEYEFLAWLCETLGVKRVIEVGVFHGVTTLALALHMPEDGLIRALDVSSEFAQIGMEAWKKAGVDKKIDFIEGPADASMQRLIDNGEAGTYDFIFVDANKDQYPAYYEMAVQLVRKGGVIAVDNTLFHGSVVDGDDSDANVKSVRATNSMIKADKRVAAVMSTMADGVYFVRKL